MIRDSMFRSECREVKNLSTKVYLFSMCAHGILGRRMLILVNISECSINDYKVTKVTSCLANLFSLNLAAVYIQNTQVFSEQSSHELHVSCVL